jgi:hypothetical protein
MKKIYWILFLIPFYTFSQKDLGSWNIVNFNLKINSRWNSFIESQLRSLSFYDQFHYYEYKGGVTYKLTPSFSSTTGVGSYNTYSEGGNFELPAQNKEIRSWIQFNLKNNLHYVSLEHRYRAEQRFTSQGYRNRFRYRISGLIPINNSKIVPKTFYIMVWNELFFTNNEPYFERNRSFIGGGYEFSDKLAIQSGFIRQFDYKINDETGRNFLNIALLYTLDLTNKNDFTPTIHD